LPEIQAVWNGQNRAVDDDAGFVARCRQGRTEEFAVLVRRHQKSMLNLAYRMTGSYDEACDIVQEAFIAAYRALGNFRGDARFSTWLGSIVINRTRNHLAQKATRMRREEPLPDEASYIKSRHNLHVLFEDNGTIDSDLERKELEAQIQECIDCLDGEQREILIMRDIEAYSYEEIGAVLNLPPGTVRSRLFRARSALKEIMKRVWGDQI